MLEIKNITKKYGEFTALNNFSIQVPKGSIYGILGPNGAGKTTFLRVLNQIIEQTEGEILWDGKELSRDHLKEIGYLPEERGLYREMKVEDQLLYLAQLRGLTVSDAREKMNDWFDRLGIEGWNGKKLRDLSKGMAQKVQFVATVMHNPSILILDEPFSGFDPVNANLIRDEILRLNAEGTTILFSTHRMESVEDLCSHICLIHQSNKILDGEKQEIKNKFRNSIYELEVNYDSELHFSEKVKSLNCKKDGKNQIHLLQLQEGLKPGDFINELPEDIDFISFRENIPSMNQIFIQSVQK
jgi:ABC-2 type transport system ATP-binding protein